MKNILIADDDYANRILPGLLLDPEKYHFFETDNGKSALEILEINEIDFLLLDISLPNISGIEICKHIKANPKYLHTKVIAYTAHAMEWEIEKIQAAGFDGVLIKPITKAQLLNALI
jgi:CheY-like chemotaxis protein